MEAPESDHIHQNTGAHKAHNGQGHDQNRHVVRLYAQGSLKITAFGGQLGGTDCDHVYVFAQTQLEQVCVSWGKPRNSVGVHF